MIVVMIVNSSIICKKKGTLSRLILKYKLGNTHENKHRALLLTRVMVCNCSRFLSSGIYVSNV